MLSIYLVVLFYFGRSSIESEPALVLGPLRSNEEQRWEQQVLEIAARKKERKERGDENSPLVEEKPDELHEPFNYEFSYWARYDFGECLPAFSSSVGVRKNIVKSCAKNIYHIVFSYQLQISWS